jgi:peptidoglycan/LPS O-acetylase OafA/YrhL
VDQGQSERFRPLDGIRGLAILMVLAVHSFSYAGPSPLGSVIDSIARASWVGVTLFFVLSGFLITGILLDTRERQHFLRDFYARRALRIFPLYFAFLALYLLLVPHVPYFSARLPQPPAELQVYYWTYLANMREWLSGLANRPSPLGPLWSLAVEEQVYVAWPFLILLVAGRRLPAVWIGLAGCSFAWRAWTRFTAQSIEASYAWSPANLEAFAAGALVAWLLRHERTRLATWARPVALVAGACTATLWAGLGHFNFWLAPVQLLTVGTSAVVALCASIIGASVTATGTSRFNRMLSSSGLCVFGRYSYAIYLFHSPVIALLGPVRGVLGEPAWPNRDLVASALFAGSVTVCSLAAAFVSWHLWEAPFLSLKRYFPLSGKPICAEPEVAVVVKAAGFIHQIEPVPKA